MARVRLVVLAAGLLLAAACGGEDTPVVIQPGPASLAQLTGPWQAEPFALDPALWSRVEQTCRRDMERRPESVAAVVDVRGASVAIVRMVGPGAGMCDTLHVLPSGEVTGAGGGWTAGDAEQLRAIGVAELADPEVGSVGGGDLKVQGFSVVGRAGGQIAAVVIEPAGIPPILATLQNGWFAGWWPTIVPPNQFVDPALAPDVVVRGYDAAGVLVDEVQT
jgi:hypothetical protein